MTQILTDWHVMTKVIKFFLSKLLKWIEKHTFHRNDTNFVILNCRIDMLDEKNSQQDFVIVTKIKEKTHFHQNDTNFVRLTSYDKSYQILFVKIHKINWETHFL